MAFFVGDTNTILRFSGTALRSMSALFCIRSSTPETDDASRYSFAPICEGVNGPSFHSN